MPVPELLDVLISLVYINIVRSLAYKIKHLEETIVVIWDYKYIFFLNCFELGETYYINCLGYQDNQHIN